MYRHIHSLTIRCDLYTHSNNKFVAYHQIGSICFTEIDIYVLDVLCILYNFWVVCYDKRARRTWTFRCNYFCSVHSLSLIYPVILAHCRLHSLLLCLVFEKEKKIVENSRWFIRKRHVAPHYDGNAQSHSLSLMHSHTHSQIKERN